MIKITRHSQLHQYLISDVKRCGHVTVRYFPIEAVIRLDGSYSVSVSDRVGFLPRGRIVVHGWMQISHPIINFNTI